MAISSRAIAAGEAFVRLMLDDEEFATAIDAWETNLRSMGRRMAAFGRGMAALAGPIAGIFTLGLRNLIAYSNQLALMESRLGIAAETLGQLSAIARITGTSLEALEVGLKTIGERLVQLQAGGQEVTSAFALAKINLEEFQNATEAERFFMMAEGIANISDAQVQAGVALRLFGEAGNRLIPMFNLIQAMGRDEALDFVERITPSQEQLDLARELDTHWQIFQLALANVSAELGSKLVPLLTELLMKGSEWLVQIIEWAEENDRLARNIGIVSFAMTFLGGAMQAMVPVFSGLIAMAVRLRGAFVFIWRLIPSLPRLSGGLVELNIVLGRISSTFGRLAGPVGVVLALLTAGFRTLTDEDGPIIGFQRVLLDTQNMLADFFDWLSDRVTGGQLGRVFEILATAFSVAGTPVFGWGGEAEPDPTAPGQDKKPPGPPASPTAASAASSIGSPVGIASQFASGATLNYSGIGVIEQQAIDISEIRQNTEISKDSLQRIVQHARKLAGE